MAAAPPPPWFPPAFPVAEWNIAVGSRRRDSAHHVDRLCAELAALQHGTVARRQLLFLGVGDGQIRARLRSGHLHCVRPGVYAVGHADLTTVGRRMGLVLAGGRGARLAGWSGATQRLVLPQAGVAIDIAIPPDRRVTLPGAVVRRIAASVDDVELVDGIPTHSMARLLLDLAQHDDDEVLEWAWRQAIYRKELDVQAVELLLGRCDGASGTPALRALYERRAALVGELRNRFELRMLSIIREAGLPEPRCNMPLEVAGGLVLRPDFRIDELMLIVEGDGKDGHADVEFLLTDAERDARYAALGYATQRYGWWEAKRERGRVIGRLQHHQAAVLGGAHGIQLSS